MFVTCEIHILMSFEMLTSSYYLIKIGSANCYMPNITCHEEMYRPVEVT